MTYAKDTTVSPETTLREIQATVKRYGAASFGFAEEAKFVSVVFEMSSRRVQFRVPLPVIEEYMKDKNGHHLPAKTVRLAFDKAIRQRYRALLLVIKAKLESVESGIETFDQAFLAELLLPSGRTVSEWLDDQNLLAIAPGTYERG